MIATVLIYWRERARRILKCRQLKFQCREREKSQKEKRAWEDGGVLHLSRIGGECFRLIWSLLCIYISSKSRVVSFDFPVVSCCTKLLATLHNNTWNFFPSFFLSGFRRPNLITGHRALTVPRYQILRVLNRLFLYSCSKLEHPPLGDHSCTTGNRSQNLCYDS